MADILGTTGTGGDAAGPRGELSIISLGNALLRRWRLIVFMPLGIGIAVGILSFFLPPAFTATATFVPEVPSTSTMPSALSGIAGQFGVSIGSEGSQSPQFYAQVLMGPGITNQVLQTRFADPRPGSNPGDSVKLLSLLGLEGDSLADSLEAGRALLLETVVPRINILTSIVDLDVETRYATLSADVANAYIRYLNAFNTETRQSQARARRDFMDERLKSIENELRSSEASLRAFYERNRLWRNSPQLVIEEERLRRQVDSRQEMQTTLLRTYEQARIEEVNDTPVITVVNWASPPRKKSKPQQKLLVVFAVAASGMLAVFWALGTAYLGRVREDAAAEFDEFQSLAVGIPLVGRLLNRRRRG